MFAFLLLPACSGDSTGAGGLSVKLDLPGTVVGTWADPGQILNCRPEMTVTATGQGKAVWTGGTSHFTAGYGDYDFTYTASDVAFMVGAPEISAGQTLTVVLPRSGYATFHVSVKFNYTVDGTGQTGSASAGFDCKAPPGSP
ncbi:MAG: hypothetical protein ACJ8J0_25555 [Longimicrobiaceae bacterium]